MQQDTYTIEEIENNVPADKQNMTRAQLIDYLLDEMNSDDSIARMIAMEKLTILCPKRK